MMLKRRREESDSDGAEDTYKTVFIDTNLDTHLALIVSHSDTISDLKKKITVEHLRCFPEMRELKISSVKVKRKGHYYHLSDTLLVRGVFEGMKNGWFLSVDASRFQCSGNDQGVLCITYPQTEAENLLTSDSFKATDKQKVFDTTESYPAHGNLASSSIVKQKEVAKVIGEFKSVKPMDNSQEFSPRSGPVAKKRKLKHKEDVVNLPVTDTHTSKHGIDNNSEFKIVGNDIASINSNEGERGNINMKLEDFSAEPLKNQPSDPTKVSEVGKKKSRMGGASAEISGVQEHGNRNNDTLDETSQSGTVANKVKILGSKESSRSSTEFNHRDVLKIPIPENSTAGKPIKAALAETVGDQSVRTDTAHKKKKKKKGKNSSTLHDEVACMVLANSDKFEGTRGLEQMEGVEMKIFDKLTDLDSTSHVTQYRLKETSPVKDHASNKESGNHELGTDVAHTTGEQEELRPNCDFEMPVSEKLRDASTRDPAEHNFGKKRSRSKKSTPHHELDKKNIIAPKPDVEKQASQNAYASDRDIVRHDGSIDATTKVENIVPKTDIDHVNEIGKEGKLSATQGAEISLPSDNNEATGATKEQILSAKKALDDKGNISGNASSTKRKKKSRRKSAEKIPDKLDVEDDRRVNCASLAAGIRPITGPLTEQSKKGEISFDARMLQISLTKKKEVSSYINDVSCAPSEMIDPPANHSVQGSNQDKNALSASKRERASEQESKSACAAGSHQQVEKVTCTKKELLPIEEKGNEAEHLLLNQTDKNQETVSIVEKRLKTKTKKSQSSKKSKSILTIQDQEVSHKELAASNDNLRDVNPLPETMEMVESGKNSHVDQLAFTKLENLINSGIDSNSESSRKDVRNADSFRVPSHTLAKGTVQEMHESDVNTDKSEGINFKQYFLPGQHGEVASKKPTKSNRETKAGRKLKDGMTSKGTSEDILSSRIEVALPSRSSAQGDKTLEEAGKLATFDAPAYMKKSEESMDESTSSSSSKGSDRFPEDNRQQTGSEIQSLVTRNPKMRTGDIEDLTQPKKGLLPTPGPKFVDSRSRRSDSKGGGKSDSSTETPSDYSSSSGDSAEGSEISQASTPTGANVAKQNGAGAKLKAKSNFLGDDISMDVILRSSSRFKKAKVMAAQCQDEESQPVDVVPDSLADTQNQ
ncbi:uncharacterized protein LOC132641204 isoform X2 [Lycium barbarum]|uniref:uncharacterized protein LOC132641204 isoform X2 n=1 Tax=Lycium barbarum TaxID=112863 RepID=UPI00293F31F7|nr:uncharacterized protein LOC132641204 isoform X2 [Lycium barbarum]